MVFYVSQSAYAYVITLWLSLPNSTGANRLRVRVLWSLQVEELVAATTLTDDPRTWSSTDFPKAGHI